MYVFKVSIITNTTNRKLFPISSNDSLSITICQRKKRPFKINKFSKRKFDSIESFRMADPNLVTTCNFHGQEFLFKMNVVCSNLEILVTDKNSGEEWQCSYDATCKATMQNSSLKLLTYDFPIFRC